VFLQAGAGGHLALPIAAQCETRSHRIICARADKPDTNSELRVMLNPDVTNRELVLNEQLVFRKRFYLLECRKPNFVVARKRHSTGATAFRQRLEYNDRYRVTR
jgi:hypothetical protein